MKILICAATSPELKTIKEEIKKLNLNVNLPIEYLCTGIGNISTTLSLTEYLTKHSENDYVIVNIGVCGYTQTKETCIQGATVYYLPTGKEAIIPIFLKFSPLRKLISSETIVHDEGDLGGLQDGEYFIDMESWAIEQVGQHFRYPRIILKVPIDKIGKETCSFDREKALEMLRNQIDYKELIEKMIVIRDKGKSG